MDDHETVLVRSIEERIKRAELRLEQQRLHIGLTHPLRRQSAEHLLKQSVQDLIRLYSYRQGLLTQRNDNPLH